MKRRISRHLGGVNWLIRKFSPFKIVVRRGNLRGKKQEYLENKDKALALALLRLEHFNKIYEAKISKVNIKNQKTRWGSCSRKGNINFNYKIALIPSRLADYIIVHELCHLKEFNHSRKFWNLVAETIPDWRERRGELKKSGKMSVGDYTGVKEKLIDLIQ